MSSADIETARRPIAGEDPCGPNLEYDAQFAELERASAGKPEQQIGSTIVKAEDPDWIVVQREALALLVRTKDLRVAVHLTKALLRTGAWEGFAGGLNLLRDLLDQSWEGLHPRLDPDDDNDPTTRINILAGLADAATTTAVRATPLLASRAAGRFALRDVEIAAGEAAAAAGSEDAPSTMAAIEGVASEIELADLEARTAAVARCAASLDALEALVSEKTGHSQTLGRLPAVVKKAAAFLESRAAARRPVAASGAESPGQNGAPAAGGGRTRETGEISSREDVLRALDRIIAYYGRHEPSSPIPILLERSKKLVAMSFVDIIKELVPDGMSTVEVFRGRSE